MSMVRPLDENQGPLQLHDHDPWLMHAVALDVKRDEIDDTMKLFHSNRHKYTVAYFDHIEAKIEGDMFGWMNGW